MRQLHKGIRGLWYLCIALLVYSVSILTCLAADLDADIASVLNDPAVSNIGSDTFSGIDVNTDDTFGKVTPSGLRRGGLFDGVLDDPQKIMALIQMISMIKSLGGSNGVLTQSTAQGASNLSSVADAVGGKGGDGGSPSNQGTPNPSSTPGTAGDGSNQNTPGALNTPQATPSPVALGQFGLIPTEVNEGEKEYTQANQRRGDPLIVTF